MNILFVLEKPSLGKIVKEVLEKHKDIFKDNYFFDYPSHISHLNDNYIKLRKVKDDYFIRREKQKNIRPLVLDGISIPFDTYMEFYGLPYSYNKSICHKDMDMIISLCDYDYCGRLKFAKYVETYGLYDSFVLKVNDYTEEALIRALCGEDKIPFQEDFEKLKEELLQTNFESEYPRKNDILALRKKTGMSRREFSEYFKIPYRTLENWEFDVAECTDYMYELIEYKLKSEKIIKE